MARRRAARLPGLAGLLATAALISAPLGVPGSVSAAVAADQLATIAVLPSISQPGTKPAAMASAQTVVVVQVQPATVGRRVVLAHLVKQSWRAVAATRLDARGLAEFTVPANGSQPEEFRATTDPADGLPALTTTSVRAGAWGPVDFADEFGGTSLAPAWGTRGTDYNPAGLRGCSKGSPNAAVVSGGTVRLLAVADPARTDLCTAYRKDGSVIGQFRYRLNGHIGTQLSADLRYGVAAARVKFQPSRGQHGAFWLQPTASAPGSSSPADAGAEIDAIEWFGDGSGGLGSNVYYPSPTGLVKAGGWVDNQSSFLASATDSWWTGYHVFSVEWTPTAYIFRIDGRETWRTVEGVSGTPEYLILSLLSSDYELPLLGGEGRLPQQMYVDWAAFWEA
jgi:beta-glucanase (GH16 family)